MTVMKFYWSDIPNVSDNLNSKDKLAKLIRFVFCL